MPALRYGYSRHRRPAVDQGNPESAVRSLIKGVSDRQAEARRYLADHAEPDDASLIATCSADVIRYAGVVRESGYAGFRRRGIPVVHRVAVAGPFRRRSARHCSRTRPGNWPATRASPRRPSPWACSTSTARLSGRTDDDLII